MSFAFNRAEHDRAAHLRKQPEVWDTEHTKYLVLGGEHVASVDGPSLAWLSRADIPEGILIYLGQLDGHNYAAVLVDRVDQKLAPVGIRTIAPQLAGEELSLAIHAVAMGRWLAGNRHCPACGEEVDVREAGHLLVCPSCGKQHFPRTDPAVIMLVIDINDRALIARNAQWPEKRFSTLAGFVEPGESLEDAVRREVHEEVGIDIGDVSYLGSQPWPFPTSLMLGFHARAASTEIVVDENEIAEARWFTRDELRAATANKEVLLPPTGVSISTWLIEQWLGEKTQGSWF